MTMQELYDAMKDAINFFGLRFGDMAEIAVHVHGSDVTFTYQRRSMSLHFRGEEK